MSTPDQQELTAPAGVGSRSVGRAWFTWFTVVWVAVWMSNQTPVQLLLPLQVNKHSEQWVHGVVVSGAVLGVGGLISLVAGPVAGMLSDRTPTRIGRRRPWAIGGSVVAAAALVVLSRVTDNVAIGLTWTVYSVAFAVAATAFTALIADQLDAQRGAASGVVGGAQGAGLVLGVALVVVLGLSLGVAYLVLAVFLLVAGVAGALALPDPPVAPVRRDVPRGEVRGSRGRDFRTVVLSRAIVSLGNGAPTSLLLFFLLHGIEMPHHDAESILLLTIVVFTVSVIVSSAVGGRISDATGNRRGLVMTGSTLLAVGALLLLLVPTPTAVLVSGLVNGTGYGLFLTVGLAMATDLLPAEADNGRDIAFVNVATNIGAVGGPLLGAGLVAAVGDFRLMYLVAAVLTLGGGLLLLAVRRPERARVV
ncbi:MFS transporter [Kineococcus sp. SYSU DK001]|uniref:MFS transporter n=1 Tax=Kineococcus sp. SYSU DK001 TaxID=3383122 RepID=UPI003D7C6F30